MFFKSQEHYTIRLKYNKDKYKSLDSVQKKRIDKFSGHAFSGWASNLIDRQNAKMKEVAQHEVLVTIAINLFFNMTMLVPLLIVGLYIYVLASD